MAVAVLESFTNSSNGEDGNETEERDHKIELLKDAAASDPGTSKAKRGRMVIITPELATTLDRTKLSDRKTVFVVAEIAKSLGCYIKEVSLNRSTIRRKRIASRINPLIVAPDKRQILF